MESKDKEQFINIVKPKDKKNDASENIFFHRIDPSALQMVVDRQREKMASLEVHEAATMGDYDALEDYIHSERFDINMKDPEWQDRTPLHWACSRGFVECVRLLVNKGAKGTARMSMGWTPAHCAAEAGRLNVLRALHAAEVPVDKRDKYGDTPRKLAETYGHWECVNFLTVAEEELAEKRRNQDRAESDESDQYDLSDNETEDSRS